MRLSVQKEAGTVMNERLPLVLTVLGPPYYMPYNGAPRITLATPPCDSSSSDRDDTEQVSPDSGQDEIIACPAILRRGGMLGLVMVLCYIHLLLMSIMYSTRVYLVCDYSLGSSVLGSYPNDHCNRRFGQSLSVVFVEYVLMIHACVNCTITSSSFKQPWKHDQ
jgi:hypothetical protein